MKKCVPLLLLSLLCWAARAQNPVVPNNIYFADLHLQLNEDARADVQKIVDALRKHPSYFQKKVDLADAYFPFIEQALQQEGVPTDIKYLALQESGLVSDAVSTSNAVGFWQFKEGSATDVGLRVNSQVDERKHIYESSRGAAKYLLRNNNYYQNWFNALLSYYQGLTGTKALTKTSDIGAKKMYVDGRTNKYLLTFLAHKIAYENAIGRNPNPPLALQLVAATPGQTLMDIALQAQADVAQVETYNKWLTASTIPNDKPYLVLIPVTGTQARPSVLAQAGPVRATETAQEPASRRSRFTKVNGLKAVIAGPGDTKDKLALQAKLSTRRFLRYNDLRSFDPIEPGKIYYLQAKKSKAETEFHVARAGETMFEVSQQYGVKLTYLLSKNRMKKTEALVPGRVVWLQNTRPRHTPIEIRILKDAPAALAPQPVLAQKAPATPPPAKPKPAATPVEVPKPASTPQTTAQVSTPQPAATPTAPVKPRAGAISIEVEDTTVAPYESIDERYALEEETTPIPAAPMPVPDTAWQKNTDGPVFTGLPDTISMPESSSPVKAKPQHVVVRAGAVHVVEKGETLYAISKLYNIAMEDLLAWNQLDVTAPLALGQKLNLTGPKEETAFAVPSARAGNVFASPTSTEHTVAAGETLYSISRTYNISLQDLQNWNDLGSSGSIAIGQKLVVVAPANVVAAEVRHDSVASVAPAASSRAVAGVVTHRVAPGESMYQISRKYGVTIKEIMDWNRKPDFNVSVGENLIIKPKL